LSENLKFAKNLQFYLFTCDHFSTECLRQISALYVSILNKNIQSLAVSNNAFVCFEVLNTQKWMFGDSLLYHLVGN